MFTRPEEAEPGMKMDSEIRSMHCDGGLDGTDGWIASGDARVTTSGCGRLASSRNGIKDSELSASTAAASSVNFSRHAGSPRM